MVRKERVDFFKGQSLIWLRVGPTKRLPLYRHLLGRPTGKAI
jgi:hypothetical protein